MSKELNISIIIGCVLSVIVLTVCIALGVFSYNEIKFTEPTVIDKTEETLQIIIGDNLEELSNYNKDYKDLFLPNLVQNSYFKSPNLNSEKYLQFSVWSGSETESNTYGLATISDWQCQLKKVEVVSIDSYASKKAFAYQQVGETISLTNVKHVTGICKTPFTWANGMGNAAFGSEGNLQDFRKVAQCSYFKRNNKWYVLEWSRDVEDIVSCLYKGVLKHHLSDFEQDNTSRSISSNILLNGYCKIYEYDFNTNERGGEVHFNIVAPYKFTYYNTPCKDGFVLNNGLEKPIEF